MKIAAASCCKLQQINPQPIWDEIRAERPDALVLLGDNVYLDSNNHTDPVELGRELQTLYEKQLAEPHFAALLADMAARDAPVIAIYDDHDFLGNNRCGGSESPALGLKAREVFISAFAPLRTGADVYSRRRLGLVEVIVLDERLYRRDAVSSQFDRDAVLGDRQWAWFEHALAAAGDAPFVLIVSSTTVHRFGLSDECWEFYPAAFKRLRELLAGRAGAFVVSGDIHENNCYDDSGIVEIVTSAVARKGLFWGAARANYGIFNFDAEGVDFKLHGRKSQDRLSGRLLLSDWRIS